MSRLRYNRKRAIDALTSSCPKMAALGDESIIERLCRVRGIGPWTAQTHLIFSLGRPDVMPATDLGIQKGVQLTYDLPDLP